MVFHELYMTNEGWDTQVKLRIIIDSGIAQEYIAQQAAEKFAAYQVVWFSDVTVSLASPVSELIKKLDIAKRL